MQKPKWRMVWASGLVSGVLLGAGFTWWLLSDPAPPSPCRDAQADCLAMCPDLGGPRAVCVAQCNARERACEAEQSEH